MLEDLRYRLRAIFRRKTVETELTDELRFHFDKEVEKLTAAGAPPGEAERRARLALGGIEQTKEDCREARGTALLESLVQDAGYAVRVLRKSPAFTAAVTLSLALGIGANTAIFSLLDALMWRSLPVRNPESLYIVDQGVSFQQYRAMAQNREIADLAAYAPVRLNVSIDGSLEPTAEGQLVSGAYFSVAGVNPAAGRAFSPEDDRVPNGHPVAVISHGYWKRRFNLAPSTIGRSITLCGAPFTIIGVAPPEFFGIEVGAAPDIFVPLMMQPTVMPAMENLLDRPIIYSTWLRVVGRLKPGVHPRQAASALSILWREQMPQVRGGKFAALEELIRQGLRLSPASTGISNLRRQFSEPLFVLMAVVAVVLLIACANTANLLMARAAARRPEFAVRLALGAGRLRLARQLLVECLLLSILGGAAGLALAGWATRLLVAFMSTGRTPIVLDLSPDIRILAFTGAVSILTAFLFGLTPALRATRIDTAQAIKSLGTRLTSSRSALRSGKTLAVTQVALSLMLLAAAGLFVRSLRNLNSQDAGFSRDSVLIVRVEPKGSDQRNISGTSQRLDRIYRELLERVDAIPGVRSVTLAHFSPVSRITFSSPVDLPSGERLSVASLMVYPGYFKTIGIQIVAGRDFDSRDLGEKAPLVAVINETFSRRAFPNESAAGKQYKLAGRPVEIIGVVKDSRYANLREETPPVMYQPFLQTRTGRGQMSLHVRTGGEAGPLLQRVREEVHKIDPDLPLFNVRTLSEEMDSALIRERLIALLSSLFSGLAVLLACVGLYGLLAFSVAQRTGEMGIRMALGARRRDVTAMVMREGMWLVLLGVCTGVPAAIAVARLASSKIAGLLFGLSATDPVTIASAAALLAIVAAVAGYLPARRASTVNPMIALRNE